MLTALIVTALCGGWLVVRLCVHVCVCTCTCVHVCARVYVCVHVCDILILKHIKAVPNSQIYQASPKWLPLCLRSYFSRNILTLAVLVYHSK